MATADRPLLPARRDQSAGNGTTVIELDNLWARISCQSSPPQFDRRESSCYHRRRCEIYTLKVTDEEGNRDESVACSVLGGSQAFGAIVCANRKEAASSMATPAQAKSPVDFLEQQAQFLEEIQKLQLIMLNDQRVQSQAYQAWFKSMSEEQTRLRENQSDWLEAINDLQDQQVKLLSKISSATTFFVIMAFISFLVGLFSGMRQF